MPQPQPVCLYIIVIWHLYFDFGRLNHIDIVEMALLPSTQIKNSSMYMWNTMCVVYYKPISEVSHLKAVYLFHCTSETCVEEMEGLWKSTATCKPTSCLNLLFIWSPVT